jgi:hypothetical protein
VQQYPFDIPTEAFPFEIFKQAFVAVQSCVVHLQVMYCGMDLGYITYRSIVLEPVSCTFLLFLPC